MKKPILFLILKIVGISLITLGVYAIYLIITGFGDFESNKFMIGSFLILVSIFGIPCTIIGFRPEISKLTVKTARYIQEENREDLTAVATGTAQIVSGAVSTIATSASDAIARVVSQEQEQRQEQSQEQTQEETQPKTMYCKHCGEKIDADSKFCKACGKEQ